MKPERPTAFVIVPPEPGPHDRAIVAALRCYAAARGADRALLPEMVAFAAANGIGASAVIALASVFELTEACLGRPLVPGEDAAASADEAAVLMLLASAGEVGPGQGSAAVPHGMPGALVWAARSAVQLTGGGCRPPEPRATCPFQP